MLHKLTQVANEKRAEIMKTNVEGHEDQASDIMHTPYGSVDQFDRSSIS